MPGDQEGATVIVQTGEDGGWTRVFTVGGERGRLGVYLEGRARHLLKSEVPMWHTGSVLDS